MSMVLGRMNWLTTGKDNYEVIFKPTRGGIITVIARGMSREDALSMMNEFNDVIDDFRQGFPGGRDLEAEVD